MIAADLERGWSLRAAFRGASKAVLPAYVVGATLGLVLHIPVLAGPAAFAGVVIGAARSLSR